jgi:quinol monooxygenase YgiN
VLINAVIYTFPPERADEAAALFAELAAASRAEAGCISYEVARGSGDDAATFALFEKWRDAAALDEHYATDAFQSLGVHGIRTFATSRTAVKGALIT